MIEIIDSVTPIINKFVITIIILLIGFMIGKLAGEILKKIFIEIQLDKMFSNFTDEKFAASNFFSSVITVTIYIVSFFFALNQLGIVYSILQIIGIIILIIVAISILLWMFEFMPNFYGWFLIKTKMKFVVGDKITAQSVTGVVKKISLLRTWIETKENERIIFSNFMASKEARRLKKKSNKSN